MVVSFRAVVIFLSMLGSSETVISTHLLSCSIFKEVFVTTYNRLMFQDNNTHLLFRLFCLFLRIYFKCLLVYVRLHIFYYVSMD
jgi:hypothetical protein